MLRKIGIIFLILLFPIVSNAADITVKAFVYQDYTIYNYAIEFQVNDSISKFSIEKPKDAILDYAVDKFGTVNYESAGDFFIFKPKEIKNNYFLIKYKSEDISNTLFKTDAFKTYFSFDFPIDNLKFNLEFKDNFGEELDIFPQNFNLDTPRKIIWEFKNVTEDLLFVVNFKDPKSNIELNSSKKDLIYNITIFILIIIIIGLLSLYIIKKKTVNKKQEVISKTVIEPINEENNKIQSTNSEENNTLTINEIVEKHLTDNEGEVLLLIRDNDGISQHDILNYLPRLTKSNLSKIISKLHARKILKRIKVGKINKIYLGDKIKK